MNEPNNDEVICPKCCEQFRAIPVNVQAELRRLRDERDTLQDGVISRDMTIDGLRQRVKAQNDLLNKIGDEVSKNGFSNIAEFLEWLPEIKLTVKGEEE